MMVDAWVWLGGNLLVASVIAVLAIGARSLRVPARVVHGLWLLVLVKLVTPPLVPIEVMQRERIPQTEALMNPAWFGASGSDLRGNAVAQVQIAPKAIGRSPIGGHGPAPWILLFWAIGSGVAGLRAVRRSQATTRLLRLDARPLTVPPADLQAEVRLIADRMGLRNPPSLRIGSSQLGPLSWIDGGRAQLHLPNAWLQQADVGQRQAVLAHELAHLRLRHHRWRRFEQLVAAIYWWCPMLQIVRAGLRQSEEESCDALALVLFPEQGAALAYALIEGAGQWSSDSQPVPLGPTAMGWTPSQSLEQRIRALFDPRPRRAVAWSRAAGIAALAVIFLPLSATLGRGDAPGRDRSVHTSPPVRTQFDSLKARCDQLDRDMRQCIQQGRSAIQALVDAQPPDVLSEVLYGGRSTQIRIVAVSPLPAELSSVGAFVDSLDLQNALHAADLAVHISGSAPRQHLEHLAQEFDLSAQAEIQASVDRRMALLAGFHGDVRLAPSSLSGRQETDVDMEIQALVQRQDQHDYHPATWDMIHEVHTTHRLAAQPVGPNSVAPLDPSQSG